MFTGKLSYNYILECFFKDFPPIVSIGNLGGFFVAVVLCFGGIKKKSSMRALRQAVRRTGRISKNMAERETQTSKINATILWSIALGNK